MVGLRRIYAGEGGAGSGDLSPAPRADCATRNHEVLGHRLKPAPALGDLALASAPLPCSSWWRTSEDTSAHSPWSSKSSRSIDSSRSTSSAAGTGRGPDGSTSSASRPRRDACHRAARSTSGGGRDRTVRPYRGGRGWSGAKPGEVGPDVPEAVADAGLDLDLGFEQLGLHLFAQEVARWRQDRAHRRTQRQRSPVDDVELLLDAHGEGRGRHATVLPVAPPPNHSLCPPWSGRQETAYALAR